MSSIRKLPPLMDNEFIKSKALIILHLDVWSLLSKMDTLRVYLEGSNIVVSSETWLNEHIPNNIPNNIPYIRGYTIIRNDRQCFHADHTNKSGGAVAI